MDLLYLPSEGVRTGQLYPVLVHLLLLCLLLDANTTFKTLAFLLLLILFGFVLLLISVKSAVSRSQFWARESCSLLEHNLSHTSASLGNLMVKITLSTLGKRTISKLAWGPHFLKKDANDWIESHLLRRKQRKLISDSYRLLCLLSTNHLAKRFMGLYGLILPTAPWGAWR